MSCVIETYMLLGIYSDDNGYQEFEKGSRVQLYLKNDETVSGKILEILSTELTIELKNGNLMTISFNDINGYL